MMTANDQLISVLRTMNARSEEYERRLQSSKVRRALARVALRCGSRRESLRGLIQHIVEQTVEAEARATVLARCEALMEAFFNDLGHRPPMDPKAALVFQRDWVERSIRGIEAEEEDYALPGMVFAMDDVVMVDSSTTTSPPATMCP